MGHSAKKIVTPAEDAVEKASEAPQEAQDGPQGEYSGIAPPATGKPLMTAFLVLVEPDGTSYASNDVNQDIVLARAATTSDMYRAAAEIMKDIQAMETAERTVALSMQAAAGIAEQQRTAKIAAKLQEKGIHVPPGSPGAHRR